MKLLLMSTDHRDGWSLGGKLPTAPLPPGETAVVKAEFAGPLAFIGLKIGPDDRVQALGPHDFTPQSAKTAAQWRIDEVKIDDVAIERPSMLYNAAEAANTIGEAAYSIRGAFGVGLSVEMRVTNIDTKPAYFYATWELEVPNA